MDDQASRATSTHGTWGVGDTLERILREVESASPTEGDGSPTDDLPPSETRDGENPFGAFLGGLAGNPALLSAIPALMENIGPLLAGGSVGRGVGGGHARHSVDRHTALLCAVKPYLGSERQEAAERIIRLCRAWDALQRAGVTDLLRGLSHGQPRDESETREKGDADGYVQ